MLSTTAGAHDPSGGDEGVVALITLWFSILKTTRRGSIPSIPLVDVAASLASTLCLRASIRFTTFLRTKKQEIDQTGI
jgi:hypothetical protein